MKNTLKIYFAVVCVPQTTFPLFPTKNIQESLEAFEKHLQVMDNNLGFYSDFMDATILETVYDKEATDTLKTNFINWLHEFIKLAEL